MSIFSRLFGKSKKHPAVASKPPAEKLPANWKQILRKCDFRLAYGQLARVFRIANQEAAARGGEYIYPKEFVEGVKAFAKKPCFETAAALFEGSSDAASWVWECFAQYCPGGDLLFFDSLVHLGDKAIADLTEAIRLDPNNSEAYFERAAEYRGKGEDDKASADLTEAIRLNPAYAEAYYLRGVIYADKGDSKNAKLCFDQAKRLGFKPE